MNLARCCSLSVVVLAILLAGLRQFIMITPMLQGSFPFEQSDYFSGLTTKFNENLIPDLTGRVILITGANSGLGFSNSKFIAKKGATLVMACRTLSKCDAAKEEIMSLIRGDASKIITMRLDLGDLSSVKEFSTAFKKKFTEFHHLILNAGVSGNSKKQSFTKDGIEQVFGVNHVGHFYLTSLLIENLKPFSNKLPTIAVVASTAHFMAESMLLPEKPFKSAELLAKINNPGGSNYALSKAANVFFANELAERYPHILVNSLHPGAVLTPMLSKLLPPVVNDLFVGFLADRLLYTTDTSVMTQIYAAVGDEIQEKKVTARYFVPNAKDSVTSDLVKDKQLQKDLWEFTETLLAQKGFMCGFWSS